MLTEGVYIITIVFSEPVTNPRLSIDGGIGPITLTSSEPVNNQRTFSGRLTISDSSPGRRTMSINAYDLARNEILQISPSLTN